MAAVKKLEMWLFEFIVRQAHFTNDNIYIICLFHMCAGTIFIAGKSVWFPESGLWCTGQPAAISNSLNTGVCDSLPAELYFHFIRDWGIIPHSGCG